MMDGRYQMMNGCDGSSRRTPPPHAARRTPWPSNVVSAAAAREHLDRREHGSVA